MREVSKLMSRGECWNGHMTLGEYEQRYYKSVIRTICIVKDKRFLGKKKKKIKDK